MKSSAGSRRLLVVSLAGINLMVWLCSALWLWQSLKGYDERAATLSRNVSNAVAQSLDETFGKIDLMLLAVADQIDQAGGQLDAAKGIAETLDRYRRHLPQIEALRIADADGTVLLGNDLIKGERITVADRDYFLRQRDGKDEGLSISMPILGRISNHDVVVLARRFEDGKGHFAGVVYATINTDYFTRLLARFGLGSDDIISLRSSDLGVIANYPDIQTRPAGRPGSALVSDELRRLIGSGAESATYTATVPIDGVRRTSTFRRLKAVPTIVIVGLSRSNALKGWHREIAGALSLDFGFLLFSSLLGRILIEAIRSAEREAARTEAYLLQASDGIHILDRKGHVLEVSDAFCRMLGYERDEMIGMPVTRWDVNFTPAQIHEIIDRLLCNPDTVTFETSIRRKDGRILDAEMTACRLVLDDQPLLHVSARDITERKRRSSQLRLQALVLDQIRDQVTVTDLEGTVLFVNRAEAEIRNRPPEDLIGKPLSSYDTRPKAARVIERTRKHALAHDGWAGDVGNVLADGTHLILAAKISLVRDEGGKPVALVGISSDITKQRMAEKALRESEVRYRAAFESTSDTINITRLSDGRYLDVNQSFLETTGYHRDEVLGKTAVELDIWADPEDRRTLVENLRRDGTCRNLLARFRKKNGENIWGLMSAATIEWNGVPAVLSVTRDITEIREQHEIVAGLLAEKEAILENALVGIALHKNRRIVTCNRRFEEIFGYPPKAMIGQSTRILYRNDESFIAIREQFLPNLLEGTSFRASIEMVRADGSPFWGEVTGRALDQNNPQQGSIWIVSDVSERREAEQDRRRLDRALRLLSDANLAIVRAVDEASLLNDVCRLMVEVGGYMMAWIGYAEKDAAKTVRPVATSGHENGYLDGVRISWDGRREEGKGPTGTAIRTGAIQINLNSLENPALAPWRTAIIQRGYKSSIALPLRSEGGTIGALTVYASEIGVFGRDEVALLDELARNLSFGIETHRTRDMIAAAQAELAVAATAFNSQEGMLVTDARGTILRVNQAFTAITGYSAREAVGLNPRVLSSGRQDKDFYEAMWQAIDQMGTWQGEIWNRRKDGSDYLAWLTITAVRNRDGAVTHYVGTQFDITERKKAEERINELAFYDQLTGLPNRTLLIDRVRQAMRGASRSGAHEALLMIDLDNFKTLNDTLGHDFGDSLLKQVAHRLCENVRAEDTVSRWGGDEFLIMLVGLSPDQDEAAAQAETVAEKIRQALNQGYLLSGVPYHCTPSIGVTLFGDGSTEFDDILKQADLAMYRAKGSGRNAIRFYDPEMEATVKARASLENELRAAIEDEQLCLHYQPQIAGARNIAGVEALVRWQHPRQGLVPPSDFIPLAEETGLILQLGSWVMEAACRQLAVWSGRPGLDDVTIAVNVSAQQFRQADFVEQVLGLLHRTGANPRRLKLELTESLLIENIQDVVGKMSRLKEQGVCFSLDDFGTGYSSLSYLKRLPLDQLKIDQSFVHDVLFDPNDAAIARTIVNLAQSLGLDVIAEGVESADQRDFLALSGCLAFQGYFFSRPLPIADFELFFAKGP